MTLDDLLTRLEEHRDGSLVLAPNEVRVLRRLFRAHLTYHRRLVKEHEVVLDTMALDRKRMVLFAAAVSCPTTNPGMYAAQVKLRAEALEKLLEEMNL